MAGDSDYRMVIPLPRTDEHRNVRRRRSKDTRERAVEAYFAVLTILILGMLIGLGAYTVRTVIPELQRSHSPRTPEYPLNVMFESHSSDRK